MSVNTVSIALMEQACDLNLFDQGEVDCLCCMTWLCDRAQSNGTASHAALCMCMRVASADTGMACAHAAFPILAALSLIHIQNYQDHTSAYEFQRVDMLPL
jgi:hypothetical protein